jgi:uncharacterized membrane protein YgcG
LLGKLSNVTVECFLRSLSLRGSVWPVSSVAAVVAIVQLSSCPLFGGVGLFSRESVADERQAAVAFDTADSTWERERVAVTSLRLVVAVVFASALHDLSASTRAARRPSFSLPYTGSSGSSGGGGGSDSIQLELV